MRGRGLNKGLIEKVVKMLREMTSEDRGRVRRKSLDSENSKANVFLEPLLYSIYR